MEMVSFEDFKKVDLRIAKIIFAERVEGSDKLLRLEIDLGEGGDPSGSSSSQDDKSVVNRASETSLLGRIRQLVAGIGKAYSPENLVGKEIIVVSNLEPKTIMGLESQGMLLAAHGEGGNPVLLIPEQAVDPGTTIH